MIIGKQMARVVARLSLPALLMLVQFATASGQTTVGIDKVKLAAEVREQFIHTWHGYEKYAWGHDGLRPLSDSCYDWYGTPFYITAVDGLDTMILMGLKQEADSTRTYIDRHLSFDKDVYVKTFEFNIRLLGGLLSSYQLTGDKRLLELAEDLGMRLLPAFNSPTGMPYEYVNLKTGAVRGRINNPAGIGTYLIEFGALSKLTGKNIFYRTAKNAIVQVYDRRSKIGLVGSSIDVDTGKWLKTNSSIGAGIDSYLEYLLKGWRLFGDRDCERMWKTSIEAVNKYLADTTSSGFWYGSADMNTGRRTSTVFDALAAFFPAELALSGDLPRAEKLEDSCYKMWNLYGIEPDDLNYATMSVVSPKYYLNPEIMESAYYLYEYTHDKKYLLMGKTFLDDLVKYCRAGSGFAELKNVVTKRKMDVMETYFTAETLKYLYLLFAPSSTLDFHKVIFNTEAHPIRRTW